MRPAIEPDLNGLNRRYRPALMAFFMRRAANHSDAEDMTQELFAKLATAQASVMDNADAYIFQMAANLLRDRGRREKVRANYRASVDTGLADLEPLDPARVLLGRESLGEVSDALRELPERTRAIFLLFRLEGMKQSELATLYGISISAVQKHIFKAMTHLTKRVRASQ
ncbi:RNA polymerase sigma factor, sigma-70 family [Caulobacter sp. AP07]|uniref:RNA polymerase sigma factor n=1 Tax=Caulobacter sp. AP07 TaxID=1144304 RepID=UPI00027210A6|nr:sigma-70 family RNA polymerase sigma factor [Caulobacter sp. AP07]EJL38066.1 RNA polymerase sigma factor, sigma-70 family [Caulobacter sp. AP07]